MSLNSFTNDAQSTTVSFCLSVSLQYYMFDQVPRLIMDNQEATFIGGGSDFNTGTGCAELTYQANSTEIAQARSILFSLDTAIRTSPPPGDPIVACETAKQTLKDTYPDIDFTCKFSMAGYFTDLALPSELTPELADQIIKDTIEGAIYGPWILTIR